MINIALLISYLIIGLITGIGIVFDEFNNKYKKYLLFILCGPLFWFMFSICYLIYKFIECIFIPIIHWFEN